MLWTEWLKALFYGIVEGITEWLPISSTGHLILVGDLLPFAFGGGETFLAEFRELFDVAIQLGAIFAVLIRYRKKLNPFSSPKGDRPLVRALWRRILLASVPAAVVGVFGDRLLKNATGRDLDGWLFCSPVVASALIVYGVAFLLIEKKMGNREPAVIAPGQISPGKAFGIGWFQALSIVPGTSRSGSTILGARLLGLSRLTGAEFSFFLAIPAMFGASAIKGIGFWKYARDFGVQVPPQAYGILALGCLTAAAVSFVVIGFLTDYVKKHSFAAFGVYRILLGGAVLAIRLFQR